MKVLFFVCLFFTQICWNNTGQLCGILKRRGSDLDIGFWKAVTSSLKHRISCCTLCFLATGDVADWQHALTAIRYFQILLYLPSFAIFFIILKKLLRHFQTFILRRKCTRNCDGGKVNALCYFTRWRGHYRLIGLMLACMQHFNIQTLRT